MPKVNLAGRRGGGHDFDATDYKLTGKWWFGMSVFSELVNCNSKVLRLAPLPDQSVLVNNLSGLEVLPARYEGAYPLGRCRYTF
jgi:hypothetical protein